MCLPLTETEAVEEFDAAFHPEPVPTTALQYRFPDSPYTLFFLKYTCVLVMLSVPILVVITIVTFTDTEPATTSEYHHP